MADQPVHNMSHCKVKFAKTLQKKLQEIACRILLLLVLIKGKSENPVLKSELTNCGIRWMVCGITTAGITGVSWSSMEVVAVGIWSSVRAGVAADVPSSMRGGGVVVGWTSVDGTTGPI